MNRLASLVLLVAALIYVALPAAALAADDPLTFADIMHMRRKKQTHEQVVEVAKERGIGFDVDKATALRLKRMRFSEEQIETFKQIRADPEAFKHSEPAEDAAQDNAGQQPANNAANPQARLGPRMPDAAHDGKLAIQKEIVAVSGVDLQPFVTDSVTLWASKRSGNMHIDDLKKLQNILAKQLGGVYAKGLDKRSAHIVLCDNQYDYESFVKAMFAVYKKHGSNFGGHNPQEMALKASSYYIYDMSVINLAKIPPGEESKRSVAYHAGLLYMGQLTENRCGSALLCGFGNVCEVIMYKTPTRTLQSYDWRQLDEQGGWINLIRRLIKKEELDFPSRVLDQYSTDSMDIPHYAQAWSLVQALVTAPHKFEELTRMVRDTGKRSASVYEVYELDERTLGQKWVQSVQ